jgi:hypothetical protein
MAQSRKATAWGRASAAFVLLLGVATAVPAPAGIVRPGLFGSREIHSQDLNRFPKWRESLTRFEEELPDHVAAGPGRVGPTLAAQPLH